MSLITTKFEKFTRFCGCKKISIFNDRCKKMDFNNKKKYIQDINIHNSQNRNKNFVLFVISLSLKMESVGQLNSRDIFFNLLWENSCGKRKTMSTDLNF